MHNRFKTGRTQRIHACAKRSDARQHNSVSRSSNASISGKHSIGTDTF
jgi:hypothetical protein